MHRYTVLRIHRTVQMFTLSPSNNYNNKLVGFDSIPGSYLASMNCMVRFDQLLIVDTDLCSWWIFSDVVKHLNPIQIRDFIFNWDNCQSATCNCVWWQPDNNNTTIGRPTQIKQKADMNVALTTTTTTTTTIKTR